MQIKIKSKIKSKSNQNPAKSKSNPNEILGKSYTHVGNHMKSYGNPIKILASLAPLARRSAWSGGASSALEAGKLAVGGRSGSSGS